MSYFYRDEYDPAIQHEPPSRNEFQAEWDAAVRTEQVVPIAALPGQYEGTEWERVVSNLDGTFPLSANALEYALVACHPSTPENWIEHLVHDKQPLPWWQYVDLPGEDTTVAKWVGLRIPGDASFQVPNLDGGLLRSYVSERLAWAVLLGDDILIDMAKERVAMYAVGSVTNDDLGLFFFSLLQLYLGPVFYQRGGIGNVSCDDVWFWAEAIKGPRARSGLGRSIDTLFANGFCTSSPYRILLQQEGSRRGDLVNLTPSRSRSANEDIKPGLAPRADADEQTFITETKAILREVDDHFQDYVRFKLAAPRKRAARETAVTCATSGLMNVVAGDKLPAWMMDVMTVWDVVGLVDTWQRCSDEFDAAIAKVEGRSLFAAQNYNPRFMVWSEGYGDPVDLIGTDQDRPSERLLHR